MISCYLLDIEGTTTPIDFVTKTLFPYARKSLRAYLSSHDVASDLALLSAEYDADGDAPGWENRSSGEEAVPYLEWLMDRDRKSTALKSIQGKIWEEGYRSGALKGVVYPDVPLAFHRWKKEGKRIAIFSSGSVLAQKLIFGHLDEPLTPMIDGYFDTEVGPKRVATSYSKIASELGIAPNEILFLSDISQEVSAAKEAGMQSIQVLRDGQAATDQQAIRSFDELP